MNDKWAKTFDMCMKEMFKRVGEKYPNKKLTSHPNWFRCRYWSEDDQTKFSDWMRKLIKKRHKLTEKGVNNEVGMFILSYGWTTCKENVENEKEAVKV